MPSADERLALIRTKVERAKKHIGDLEREIKAFFDTNPYVVSLKPHDYIPHTQVYYLVKAEDPPADISAITGDVLFNLRAALDHLAYHLAVVNGTTNENILRGTYFPIFDDAQKYEAGAPRKVQGMSQAAKEAIDACSRIREGMTYSGNCRSLTISQASHCRHSRLRDQRPDASAPSQANDLAGTA